MQPAVAAVTGAEACPGRALVERFARPGPQTAKTARHSARRGAARAAAPPGAPHAPARSACGRKPDLLFRIGQF